MDDSKKRIRKELKKITEDPPAGVTADMADDNLFEWNAMICGPGDTPFEGGNFKLRVKFPPNYPNRAPAVFFYSRMFHPNVYPNGKICLDILENPAKWKAVYDTAGVLSSIQSMLGEPNPNSPANGEANNLFQKNTKEYERRVREIVHLSEKDDSEDNLNPQ